MILAIVVGACGWYAWQQYKMVRYALDLADGKIEIPWEVTAAHYFSDGSGSSVMVEHFETISKALPGTEKEAFECAFSTCSFLEMAGNRTPPAVLLSKMADFSGRLTSPLPCERFMRAFVESYYPEAQQRMVDRVMRNAYPGNS